MTIEKLDNDFKKGEINMAKINSQKKNTIMRRAFKKAGKYYKKFKYEPDLIETITLAGLYMLEEISEKLSLNGQNARGKK